MSQMGQAFALLPGSITICGMGASRLSAADAIPEESDSTARSWDNNPSEKKEVAMLEGSFHGVFLQLCFWMERGEHHSFLFLRVSGFPLCGQGFW